VRFDWGPVGATAVGAEVSVVVDVLSFTTSVTVAVERGMRVYPFGWKDARAEDYAANHDAVLAVGRLEANKPGAVPAPSLSPAQLTSCPVVPRLVLPSPNGSSITTVLQDSGSTIVAGCLRNARAVAAWLAPQVVAGRSVAVIAAGERWEQDDSLRPAIEDHLGAGAILAALTELGHDDVLSPEARSAADLFVAVADAGRLDAFMHDCVGGRELVAKGFAAADVDVAAQVDASTTVPVLVDGAFAPAHLRE